MTNTSRHRNRLTAAVGAAVALAALQSGAATPAAEDMGLPGTAPADLETVTVYARRILPVSRVAAMVSVIP